MTAAEQQEVELFDALEPANEVGDGDEVSGVWRIPLKTERKAPSGREVFERYSPMVRRIALRSLRSLPSTLTADDILSVGWVGMSEALSRRPPEMPEEEFEAYASYRIRGAILDHLRALDPLSRRLRAMARQLRHTTRTLQQKFGRAPTEKELADSLEISAEALRRQLVEAQDVGFVALDPGTRAEPASPAPSPESEASESEMLREVREKQRLLPERLQLVMHLHYELDYSLRRIGEVLGVTESRVCQLHAEAVRRLRAKVRTPRPLHSVTSRRRYG